MEKNNIKNVYDLRMDLIDIYERLRSNEIGLREAKVHISAAGMVLKSAHEQREYNIYTKSNAKIEFLESNK